MTYPEKINHLEADLQAEVERLKASNAELLEALKDAANLAMEGFRGVDPHWLERSGTNDRLKKLRLFVAKAEEGKS